MAIRMRRGNYANFDPTRMLAGEFAVCLDNGYVYMTLSPGNTIKLGTAEELEEIVRQAQEYATQAGTSAMSAVVAREWSEKFKLDSEAWAIGKRNGTDVPSTDSQYHNNSKYYAEQGQIYYNYLEEAVETHMPEFQINWATGELEYTGGYFTFWIDTDGFIHWGVEQED